MQSWCAEQLPDVWSEAENLEVKHVKNGQIQFTGTKSGRIRTIPIEAQFAKELHDHHDKKETGQRLFAYAYSAFRDAVVRSNLILQDGQLTHVLRHYPVTWNIPSDIRRVGAVGVS